MKKFILIASVLAFYSIIPHAFAENCPDPEKSSLSWGVIPEPWVKSPFSQNNPQGEKGTRFVRANILVAGMGRGVSCTYQNSAGFYSIWWPVRVKIPSRLDYNWIESYGGFECANSFPSCVFHPAAG